MSTGGLIVSLTTYVGAKGQGFLAAFVIQFPSLTVLSFLLMYLRGRENGRHRLRQEPRPHHPPWVLYVRTVVLLCDRIGIWWALVLGVGLYMAACMAMAYVK